MPSQTGEQRAMCWETMRGKLVLADGTEWDGWHFGHLAPASGELVFQTGMVGYVESLTDPSYHRQLLTLTYPLVGNYGVPGGEMEALTAESERVWPAALVVSQLCDEGQHSHWSAASSLSAFLDRHQVPGLMGVDTRALTKHIRNTGPLPAYIVFEAQMDAPAPPLPDINRVNLVREVSCKEPRWHRSGADQPLKVLAVDCGMKRNQIRCLNSRGVDVRVVPFDHPFAAEAREMDGVFLSNGPGDPSMCEATVAQVRKLLAADEPKPLMGICLGNQLLGLAAGATTSKMAFGNRGHNQPATHLDTGRCFITTQNHGFVLDEALLPQDWLPLFRNENDGTNEGIVHATKPFFSVQFHPEHMGGPEDMECLFDAFATLLRAPERSARQTITELLSYGPAKEVQRRRPRKVLVLGSGGLTIGQAGEFDYSGSQALKALKEEGIKTLLINPNIATVQTSKGFADQTFFLPVRKDYVEQVIKSERPDGILLSFGGQTALNCGLELEGSGVLAKYAVEVLGTPVSSIELTEDRAKFAGHIGALGESVAAARTAESLEEAVAAATALGYPVLVRAAFALGGLGSGFADDETELRAQAGLALQHSPQLTIDKSFRGWKEVEYEVVRDAFDNCVTVCNMENVDPLGVHTGESVVVAPSQTLTNREYQKLRTCALKVIRSLGVVGECNIQYALNPHSEEFFIIEVNARLSRSSALASKATGYPLAYVAAKLALNLPLPAIKNSVTGDKTSLCFEPSLDYVVVKMPRWDLSKFARVSTKIGSSMKSVGEAMAIGRGFEEAFQKALRMVDGGTGGFDPALLDDSLLSEEALREPTDKRMLLLAKALHPPHSYSVRRLHDLTAIDPWFLHKMKNIVDCQVRLSGLGEAEGSLSRERLLDAKQLGFSDAAIGRLVGRQTEVGIRQLRHELRVLPSVKQVDTVSAEFPCHTNYLYFTYHGEGHDVGFAGDDGVLVLGSGVYRIGSSVEFDSCAVACVSELRRLGRPTLMLNCNPETVSTDYDMCERLYFEEISFEVAMDIYGLERPDGVVLCMGGQAPNNIALALHHQKVRVLGTSPLNVDRAENRYKFSRMCDEAGIGQPRWQELSTSAKAREFCASVGYPCLIRPSYVLSGAAMNVAHTEDDLNSFLQLADVTNEHPVVVSKFIRDAKEIDVDAVAKDGRLVLIAVSEHVENAGVHSGDATLVTPPQDLTPTTVTQIRNIAAKVASNLSVSGPFNLQLIAKDETLKVIECNLRVSRSFPFVSKTLDRDFVAVATRVLVGEEVEAEPNVTKGVEGKVGVKVAQFSFPRLDGADVMLGVEMASTGEVAGFGTSRYDAYLKALISSGFRLPKAQGSIFLSIGSLKAKKEMQDTVLTLARMGYRLFGSGGTADFYNEECGLGIQHLEWPFEKEGSPSGRAPDKAQGGLRDISQFVASRNLDLIINLPLRGSGSYRVSTMITHGYRTRRLAVENGIPLVTDIKCGKLLVEAMRRCGAVEGGPPALNAAVDCLSAGRRLRLPGLVDVHVHVRDPGETHKEDWNTASRAALAGGLTLILAMPNTKTPPLTDAASLATVAAAARSQALCDFGLYVGATSDNASRIAPLASHFAGLKLYLNATHGPLQLHSMAEWEDHLRHWPKDWPLVAHAEGPTTAAVIFHAHMAQRPIHICHVSTRDEIEAIVKAKQAGMAVTCEVAPHHLFITAQDFGADVREKRSQVRPPLTTAEDIEALWHRLDFIDVFATDHAPHTLAEKDGANPPPGFPGLETMLPLLLNAVNQGRLTMEQLVQRLHTNPVRIFRLPLQPSTFVEVDMDEPWEITNEGQQTRAAWTPFAGMKGHGAVRRVVLRGEEALVDGKILLQPGFGLDVRSSEYPTAVTLPKPTPRTPSPELAHTPPKLLVGVLPPVDGSGDHSVLRSLQKSPRPGALWRLQTVDGVPDSERSLLSIHQMSRPELRKLFELAAKLKAAVEGGVEEVPQLLRGLTMGLMFEEPSTRTSASFDAAMKRLGGSVIVLDGSTSSAQKGESMEDSVRVMAGYTDLLVLRTKENGAVKRAAGVSGVPVVNAGDGTGEHPTQALLDLFTIREELGSTTNKTIALVGDLKHGRTVHSLARLLTLYEARILWVPIEGLEAPAEVREAVGRAGLAQETASLPDALARADVVYMTRVQRERFVSQEAFERHASLLRLSPELLHRHSSRPNLPIILHPLPRNDELDPALDSDFRAVYFRQARNGMFVRMALLAFLLRPAQAAQAASPDKL